MYYSTLSRCSPEVWCRHLKECGYNLEVPMINLDDARCKSDGSLIQTDKNRLISMRYFDLFLR